ncbi:unnamed protein product [Polarella glacialis]|uniref:PDZ domain-containing protein n=1 Tax=Polarella glacialis TaxID=89957 RepID=A0A813IVF9_POLGL|nr:unnamed protein product [Polarella glacialis]
MEEEDTSFLTHPLQRQRPMADTSHGFSWSRSAFDAAATRLTQPPLPAWPRQLAARLAVHPELGAGIEVSFLEHRGYTLESLSPLPGQPDLLVGDLLIEVGGRSLALASEDEADEVLASELLDGVALLVERPWPERSEHPPKEVEAPMSTEGWQLAGSSDADFDAIRETLKSQDSSDRPEAPSPEAVPGLQGLLAGSPQGTGDFASAITGTGGEIFEEDRPQPRDQCAEDGKSTNADAAMEDTIEEYQEEEAENNLAEESTVATQTEAGKENIPEANKQQGVAKSEGSWDQKELTQGTQDQEEEEDDEDEEILFRPYLGHEFISQTQEQQSQAEMYPLEVVALRPADVPRGDVDPHAVSVPLPRMLVNGGSSCSRGDVVTPETVRPTILATATRPASATSTTNATPDSTSDDEPFPSTATATATPMPLATSVVPTTETSAPSSPEEPPLQIHSPEGTAEAPPKPQRSPPSLSSAAGRSMSTGDEEPAALCKVVELEQWLGEVRLQEYLEPAARWCLEMGAVSLEEIAENIEDFGKDVALKPIERQRVQKWALQVLESSGGWPSSAGPEPCADEALSCPDARHEVAGQSSEQPHIPPAPSPANAQEGLDDQADDGPGQVASTPIYTARSTRLAVDSSGNTGLDLRWDKDWGIRVQHVDPLPGQPGLAEGDFIVAIDGCSLRHRTHEECDAVFAARLQNGAVLSVVRPQASLPSGNSGPGGKGKDGKGNPPPQALRAGGWGGGGKGRRAGHDANRMWNRFGRPPW